MESAPLPIGTTFDFPGDWQTPAGKFTVTAVHENPRQYDCTDENGLSWPGWRASVVEARAQDN